MRDSDKETIVRFLIVDDCSCLQCHDVSMDIEPMQLSNLITRNNYRYHGMEGGAVIYAHDSLDYTGSNWEFPSDFIILMITGIAADVDCATLRILDAQGYWGADLTIERVKNSFCCADESYAFYSKVVKMLKKIQ